MSQFLHWGHTHPLSRPISPTDPGRTTRIRDKITHYVIFHTFSLCLPPLPNDVKSSLEASVSMGQLYNTLEPHTRESRGAIPLLIIEQIPKRFPRNLYCFYCAYYGYVVGDKVINCRSIYKTLRTTVFFL